MCTNYLDNAGEHLPDEEVASFNGNLAFASLNTLNFKRPSRKDDLISLCYLLISLLNGGVLPYLTLLDDFQESAERKPSNIDVMRRLKGKYSLQDMV
jgi:hypothetical protein